MMHAISDSDITSLNPSSPGSPKRVVYYVQSPSRDSHDELDKSSSTTTTAQATPTFNSPVESPSHPSYGRHSRSSSASRFSGGGFRWASYSGRKGRKRSDKGWQECYVIDEEDDYDQLYRDKRASRRWHMFIGLMGFVAIFFLFCLILWGASRPYNVHVTVKSFTAHNMYSGEGSDVTGVPTKILTMNTSIKMTVYNPASFFGIHVSATPINLMYSEIIVATGQVKKYFQPRKSHRAMTVELIGDKVPLYGAGASFAMADYNGEVPMKLVFEVHSRGNVVGKLVKSNHKRHVACSLVINSHSSKSIKFKHNSCTYE